APESRSNLRIAFTARGCEALIGPHQLTKLFRRKVDFVHQPEVNILPAYSGLTWRRSQALGAALRGLAKGRAGPGSICRKAFRTLRRNDRAQPGHWLPDNRPRSSLARYDRRPPSGCA